MLDYIVDSIPEARDDEYLHGGMFETAYRNFERQYR